MKKNQELTDGLAEYRDEKEQALKKVQHENDALLLKQKQFLEEIQDLQ